MAHDGLPGEYLLESGEIELNAGRATVRVRVDNLGDRPVQVGSHTHFFEVNPMLRFDRALAYGHRLNIPAGTAVRFEPGEGQDVELVALAGRRYVFGLNNLVGGDLEAQRATALARARAEGYLGADERPETPRDGERGR